MRLEDPLQLLPRAALHAVWIAKALPGRLRGRQARVAVAHCLPVAEVPKAPTPPTSTPADGVAHLLARLPSLDDNHRKAFASQFTDTECTDMGVLTKSGTVRTATVAWVVEALPSLVDPALFTEIDYAPERLAWVTELTVSMDVAREAAGQKGAGQTEVRTVQELSRKKNKNLRARLLSKMSRVVKGDGLAAAEYARAGAAPTDEDLANSLKVLATLAENALNSTVPGVAVLAAAARLTAADVAAARGGAASLTTTGEDVALGGRAQGDRDTPAVNLIEGRIVLELKFLRDAFEDARSRGVAVPPLVVHAGLRHVLGHGHVKKDKVPAEAVPPSP